MLSPQSRTPSSAPASRAAVTWASAQLGPEAFPSSPRQWNHFSPLLEHSELCVTSRPWPVCRHQGLTSHASSLPHCCSGVFPTLALSEVTPPLSPLRLAAGWGCGPPPPVEGPYMFLSFLSHQWWKQIPASQMQRPQPLPSGPLSHHHRLSQGRASLSWPESPPSHLWLMCAMQRRWRSWGLSGLVKARPGCTCSTPSGISMGGDLPHARGAGQVGLQGVLRTPGQGAAAPRPAGGAAGSRGPRRPSRPGPAGPV